MTGRPPASGKQDQIPVLVRHADRSHTNTVLVDWMIGNSCNHSCSYCPAQLHDGSIRWQEADAIKAMFRKLDTHYARGMGKKVWIQFTGGEPTMHPQITDLLRAASSHDFKVSLISNASRTRRFWEGIASRLDAVILTYHSEFVDHNHFVEIAAFLADTMPVHVNVTLPPEGFDEVFRRAEEIGAAIPELSLSLKPLREGFGDLLYPYSPDQLRRLETRITQPDRRKATLPRTVMVREFASGDYDVRRANAMITAGQNRWKGLICSAGLESLRVHANGAITRAVCGEGGELGKIGTVEELPTTPIRCSRERCACVADILITKRQSRTIAAAR